MDETDLHRITEYTASLDIEVLGNFTFIISKCSNFQFKAAELEP